MFPNPARSQQFHTNHTSSLYTGWWSDSFEVTLCWCWELESYKTTWCHSLSTRNPHHNVYFLLVQLQKTVCMREAQMRFQKRLGVNCLDNCRHNEHFEGSVLAHLDTKIQGNTGTILEGLSPYFCVRLRTTLLLFSPKAGMIVGLSSNSKLSWSKCFWILQTT